MVLKHFKEMFESFLVFTYVNRHIAVLDCSPILSTFQVILLEHIIMCRLVTGHKATALQEVRCVCMLRSCVEGDGSFRHSAALRAQFMERVAKQIFVLVEVNTDCVFCLCRSHRCVSFANSPRGSSPTTPLSFTHS